MLSWGREMNKQLQTEISAEGVADALLKAAEAEKRKNFDRDCIIWWHMVKDTFPKETFLDHGRKHNRSELYFAVTTGRCKRLMNYAKATCATDEVPTPFMRAVYKDYLKWKARGAKIKGVALHRSGGYDMLDWHERDAE